MAATAGRLVIAEPDHLDLTSSTAATLRLALSPSDWRRGLSLRVEVLAAPLGGPNCKAFASCAWPIVEPFGAGLTVVLAGSRLSLRLGNGCFEDVEVRAPEFLDKAQSLAVRVRLCSDPTSDEVSDDVVYAYRHKAALRSALARRAALQAAPNSRMAAPDFAWPSDVAVHIVACNIREHDAIGNFCFDLDRLMRAGGVPSRLYARSFDPALRGLIRPVAELFDRVVRKDIIFFHFSILDRHMPAVAELSCHKILYYHNITPPAFFRSFHPELADQCEAGYRQLDYVASFDAIVTNSEASRDDLLNRLDVLKISAPPREAVATCPPVLGSVWRLKGSAEPIALPQCDTRLLFVGRLSPNKKIEDLLRLFAEFHRREPSSALILAGGETSPAYSEMLRGLIDGLFKQPKPRIVLTGRVSDGQLITLYRRATAFVTMSEHEGFCVPLLEAMSFDLPIFAYADRAVAETLGDSGCLFRHKDFAEIADAMIALLRDGVRMRGVVRGQRSRLKQLQTACDGWRVWQVLKDALPDSAA